MGTRFSKRSYKKTIVLEHDEPTDWFSPKGDDTVECIGGLADEVYLTDTQSNRSRKKKKYPKKTKRREGLPNNKPTRRVKKRRNRKTSSLDLCDRCEGEGFVRVNPTNKRRCAVCLGTGLMSPRGLSKMWWQTQTGDEVEWGTSQRKIDGTKFTESDEIVLPSLTPRESTSRTAFLSAGSVPTRSRIRFRSETETIDESGGN
jgi:hypothetical protein